MAISNLLWLIILIAPLLTLITLIFIWAFWEKLNVSDFRIISIALTLAVFILGINLLLFSVIGILSTLGIFPVSIIDDLSVRETRAILADWLLFLLIIAPLIVVTIFLASTATRKGQDLTLFYGTTIAIVLAFLASSLLILFAKADADPDLIDQWLTSPLTILDPIVEAGEIFLNTAFGFDQFELLLDGKSSNDEHFYREFGRTLGLATPLIFSGLVFAIAAKAGLFNIGGEGTIIIGGFVGAVIGVWLPDMLPLSLSTEILNIVHLPLVFLCAALVGAIFGFIPGVLRAYLGAHEVITTIMLNPIAYLLVFFLVRDYYTTPDLRTETPRVLDSSRLEHLLPGPLGAEYFLAIFIAVGLYFFLFRTTFGLEMRAVGENPSAAEYAGIPVKIRQVQAMAIGGAIGGIGGAGIAVGYFWYFHPSHSGGLGFDGIAVSVLGANNPLALILVAVLFGAIKNGGENLSTAMGIPKDIISAIRGLVILFAAAPLAFSFLVRKRKKIGEDEAETSKIVSESENQVTKKNKVSKEASE